MFATVLNIQIFEPFGEVELVQMPLDETGNCKGFGFVQVRNRIFYCLLVILNPFFLGEVEPAILVCSQLQKNGHFFLGSLTLAI